MIGSMLRLAVIVIALSGCRDERLRSVKAVRDEVCACKTVDCGEQAIKKLPQKDVKPDHRQQQLALEMTNCLSKLYLADRPPEDPDEAPADPEPTPAPSP